MTLDEDVVFEGEPAALRRALDGLDELADKYRLLDALDRTAPGRTAARRDAMRAVAARFPGALREWDELSQDERARRRDAVLSLAADLRTRGAAALPRFFAPQHDFARLGLAVHARLRVALDAKRRDPAAAREAGRLSARVHRAVADEAGLSVEALKAALLAPTDRHHAAAPAEDPRR